MKNKVNNQLRKKKKHCLILTQDFSLSYLPSLGHVDGRSHQSHCNLLMRLPPQLRMMFLSFTLQKMSGQDVQTYPPISLLVLLSSILIFLGPLSLGILTSSSLFLLCHRGPFIMPGALSLWMVGRLFGCHDGA